MSLPAPAAAQQQQAIPTEETALLGNVAPSSDASNASRRRALIFRAATFGVLGTHSVDVKDKIALIEYGASCDLWTAAYNAEKNGAIGVIFYNGPNRKALLGGRTRLVEWKEGDPLLKIPAVAATHSTGALLVKLGDEARITLSTRADMRVAKTFNVICEGKAGDVDKTVVVGAHLDGVAAGPGLNDNGSGSMSTLEILLTLARNKFVPKNRLVFAFWGAEEDGLLGSRHFVRDLVTKYMYEQQKLKFKPIKRPRKFDDDDEDDHEDEEGDVKYEHLVAALNFDMLGSPNYIPGIHNGTDAAEPIRPASIAIQNIFEDFFKAKDIPYDIIDMVGGSDFLPFIQNGVPAGGLATGASDIKTEAQRAKFGGLANAALDPCYHKKCDSFLNVDKTALDVMSHAAMYTVVTLGAEESLNKLFKKD
ncbi:hypothetical protein GQ42DRAFT_23412 [Ramicandelaber brevisporus]|nr:hypothetical protein GQ42DRAFT_23412 [Ramicandelaber brevisporus]